MSSIDTQLNALAKANNPYFALRARDDLSTFTFELPSPDDGYYSSTKAPGAFVNDLMASLPANVAAKGPREYFKSMSSGPFGDENKTDKDYFAFGQRVEDAPENMYATVEIDGRVVAKLYNGGSCTTRDCIGGMRLTQMGYGPDLAETRAQEIAKAVGGKVVYAWSTLNQDEWLALPVRKSYAPAGTEAALGSTGPGVSGKDAWIDAMMTKMGDDAPATSTLLEAQIFGQDEEAKKAVA